MNTAEAEVFFKRYNGQSFHMCREALPVYEKFQSLNRYRFLPMSLKP